MNEDRFAFLAAADTQVLGLYRMIKHIDEITVFEPADAEEPDETPALAA